MTLSRGSALEIRLDTANAPAAGDTVPVIHTRRLQGGFGTITVHADGLTAVPVYTSDGLSVRLLTR